MMRFSSFFLVCALVFWQAIGAEASTYRFSFASAPLELDSRSDPGGCGFADAVCGSVVQAHFDLYLPDLAGWSEPERFVLFKSYGVPFVVGPSRDAPPFDRGTSYRDPRILAAFFQLDGVTYSYLFTPRVFSVLDVTIGPGLTLISIRMETDEDRPNFHVVGDRFHSGRMFDYNVNGADNTYVAHGTWTVAEVPLPATFLLLLGAAGGLAGLKRLRQRP